MIGGLGKRGAKYTAAEMLFELRDDARNRTKREVLEKGAGKKQGGNQNV